MLHINPTVITKRESFMFTALFNQMHNVAVVYGFDVHLIEYSVQYCIAFFLKAINHFLLPLSKSFSYPRAANTHSYPTKSAWSNGNRNVCMHLTFDKMVNLTVMR